MIELSKSNRRIAREILDKGLQNEFASGLRDFEKIIAEKDIKGQSPQETYQALYRKVKNFDKHIASRYDYMKGSNYVLIIACQLIDGYITETDIEPLAEEVKVWIYRYISLM